MKILNSKKAAMQMLALIVGATCIGGAARAGTFRKVSAVGNCQVWQGTGAATPVSTIANGVGGLQFANSTPFDSHLVCPMTTDSGSFLGTANQVQVVGWSVLAGGNMGFRAQACVTFLGGGGGGCKGSLIQAPNAGVATISFDPRQSGGSVGWDENLGTDLPYVHIMLANGNVVWSLASFTP